jgi:predicted glycoside hydrolase/deacetylase ChbG (UPF0249 family)
MCAKRYLIVNADDFGHSTGVNRGIIHAHDHGIVTSASLMVRRPAAAEAVAYWQDRPSLSLGLHIDLGEWVYRNECWTLLYHVVALDQAGAVREAISCQLAIFRNLTGKDPSHIDSHQHVHLREPVRSVVLEMAEALRVPVRDCSPEVHYCGRFYGQTSEGLPYPEGITTGGLIEILAQLRSGVTELGCHPGTGDDPDTTYGRERAQEVKALCDARVRSALIEMGIELCPFTAVPGFSTTSNLGSVAT